MPSNHLTLCRPILLLPSMFPSIRVFSNGSALRMRWAKYWSFSFISPSNEYRGLISFRMDWVDLLAVQGTLKSLHQHHSSKASILQRSAFFIVQLSHPYVTTGKIIALTRWAFVGKVVSWLFNMLSRLVITVLPRSKHLLISWPQSICCDFSHSQVWLWELDYKESWAPKNWCFWAVVLEKTLESPLDCKEIQPVHLKGNQSWIFIGRTDEAETPILWPPDAKNWLILKDPDIGKDWRQEKETTEDEMVEWHHRLNGHEFD